MPSQNGATEFIIWSRSRSLFANGNNSAMPRSKPSRITYIATAMPITAAQITGRYHSMLRSSRRAATSFDYGCGCDPRISRPASATEANGRIGVPAGGGSAARPSAPRAIRRLM